MALITQAQIDGEINSLLPSGSDITAATLRQVLHDMNASVFQSGVTGFAAPSTAVGLVAQPGTTQTALRSDAQLAISQAITPVWTAQHIFASGTQTVSPTTGALTVTAPGGIGVGGSVWAGGALTTGTLGTAGVLTLNGSAINSTPAVLTVSQITGVLQVGGSLSVAGAPVQVAQRVTGTVSGTVSTSDYSFTIVSGATVLGVTAYTTTAFGAVTAVNLTAGTAAGDNAYVQAQTIKSLGVVSLLLNGTNVAGLASLPSGSPNFFVRLTQTGGNSGVGSAVIVVDYLVTP